MEILKAIFGNRANGVRGIEDLAVVPLETEDWAAADFYAVREDFFVIQPRYIGTVLSTMGQSIVPIVAIVPNESLVRCLGTGFFISCDGLLITAAHVVADPIERCYGRLREIDERTWFMGDLNLGVMISTNPVFEPKDYRFRPIEWAQFLGDRVEAPLPICNRHLKIMSDIAICKVKALADGMPYQPLSIIQPGIQGIGLAVGKKATAIGYAGMENVELGPAQNSIQEGNFNFKLHVSKGDILERFPNNAIDRNAPTPGACFSASLKLPGGMSGSPIFDDEGIYVHGVVSRGMEDEDGPTNFGSGCMLTNALGMPIRCLQGKSLLNLMASSEHGIPQMSIPNA